MDTPVERQRQGKLKTEVLRITGHAAGRPDHKKASEQWRPRGKAHSPHGKPRALATAPGLGDVPRRALSESPRPLRTFRERCASGSAGVRGTNLAVRPAQSRRGPCTGA